MYRSRVRIPECAAKRSAFAPVNRRGTPAAHERVLRPGVRLRKRAMSGRSWSSTKRTRCPLTEDPRLGRANRDYLCGPEHMAQVRRSVRARRRDVAVASSSSTPLACRCRCHSFDRREAPSPIRAPRGDRRIGGPRVRNDAQGKRIVGPVSHRDAVSTARRPNGSGGDSDSHRVSAAVKAKGHGAPERALCTTATCDQAPRVPG